jgi:hypothetical protein
MTDSLAVDQASSGVRWDASVSVVIATLGGPTLGPVIDILNSGTVVPAEILICIPRAESGRVRQIRAPNVRVVITQVRGQVAQRAEGFHQATRALVMQMDDDIHLAPDCMERLIETLHKYAPRCAVAPAFYLMGTSRSAYHAPADPAWMVRVYYWLMNGVAGYQGGDVDRACGAMGVDPQREPPGLRAKKVSWLPGGCVLSAREDLFSEAFFPFPGKAYCEDIIHSHHRNVQGTAMYVDITARCDIEVVYAASKNLLSYIRELRGDARARFYYANLTGRSALRLTNYYLVTVMIQIARRLLRVRR